MQLTNSTPFGSMVSSPKPKTQRIACRVYFNTQIALVEVVPHMAGEDKYIASSGLVRSFNDAV